MEQITMVPLEQLHPHDKNPRIDAASVTDLVESIREHGIEVPLVAALHPTDGYVVLAGHRRLTAAHALALAEAPVQIRLDLDLPGDQLAFMATENILRDQLTAVEEARLVQDMLDLGMSQAEVARQTALGKKRVSERVKLGKLAEKTGDKVHRGQITVEDALVIAEYSDDPESAAQLEDAAGTYNFDFYTSRAKARREARQAVEKAQKDAKKAGLRLADEDADFVSLLELNDEAGWTTPELDELDDPSDDEWERALADAHKSCPGHSVLVITTGYAAGMSTIGCDAVDQQHATTDTGDAPASEPEPADPWDDISPEDFAAAAISRTKHLADTLPHLDLYQEALDIAVQGVLSMGWHEYYDDEHGIALLQALTGAEGKRAVSKALRTWPLSVLIWLGKHDHAIKMHHRMMAEGRPGSTYWDAKATFRQLLDRTGYAWTEPEQRAILLATGTAHDADPTATEPHEAGVALAEGGDAA